jgi:hypothetical protein
MNRCTAAACTLALCAAVFPVLAQNNVPDFSGFWTVKFETTPSGAELIAALPEGVVLIDDTGGAELEEGNFAGLKLSERALNEVRNYDYSAELKRENTCVPPSAAFYMQAPFPMEIYQGRDLIVFKMEYFDMYRIVTLGGEHPPAAAPHSKSGHSIGRWDGDTLVVDTTHLSAATFMNNGFSHSDSLHMIERFRVSSDGSTLWLTQLYEDPGTFDGLAARYMAWTRRPGEYVYPYECDASYGE